MELCASAGVAVAFSDYYGQAAYQGNSLTAAQRELAYLTASVANDCHY